jgi:glycosyltransferase involved in cell wall biosynthesis
VSAQRQRILVISHGHPDFQIGGGEIAAYNLFKGYKENPTVEAAWFLGRIDRGAHPPSGAITRYRPDEYLWEQGTGDHFKSVTEACFRQFEELLQALKPTVVHFHHYVHVGIEALGTVKRVDPSAKVMLTLHEYLGICQNDGQMVKRGSMRLCSESSVDSCRQCFPEHSREFFWLRKQYISGHFRAVDQFVAPSEFLRQRYITWGLAPERITTIENGQADVTPLPPRELRDGEGRNRFGYFGQVNEYKGIDVLLQALTSLSEDDRKLLHVEVHAARLENQPEKFRDKLEPLAKTLMEEGVLRWPGPYHPTELKRRMARIDWVLVPSVWWENSPMVIQEAFVYGRPVICSGIGGMAEKVRDGKDGLHVEAGNSADWGDTLLRAAREALLWDTLRAGIRKPITHLECARVHVSSFARSEIKSVAKTA